eukprot:PITA_25961
MVSALKHASWRTLLDKLEAKLSSWTYRSLNIASRLIMIKSVLQAMPLDLFSILATPKWVLKAIRNLQRNFLWGSTGLNRKWALVKWSEVCQLKSNGGLGLRDPIHSNHTMGAKVWWNWLVKPHIPWAKLWQAKYALGSQWDELIRISPNIEQELSHRKIKQSNKKDKLRWGNSTKVIFTTKEAYILRYAQSHIDKYQLWNNIWQSKLWPKVSTFLWLLSKKHILTWDNLQRRGFIGPSRCPNCSLQSETILHLMDTCPLAAQLWEQIDRCNQRIGNRQGDIANLLRTWPKLPYQSPLLNSLWNLIPGFLYWTLWKERNNRVFNNRNRPYEILWLLLKQNIQETLALRAWH